MGVSINLEFGNGDFEHGFEQGQFLVKITTLDSKSTQVVIQLPPSPEIPKLYQDWKQKYYTLLSGQCRFNNNTPGNIPSLQRQGGFKITLRNTASREIFLQECHEQAKALLRQLNEWLQPLKLQLEPVLVQYLSEEIYLVIHTQNVTSLAAKDTLNRLPWHEWDLLLQDVSNGNSIREAVLCFNPDKAKPPVASTDKMRRVRIISIFGDSQNIDTEVDRKLLSKLEKQGAELDHLIEPSRADFEMLRDKPCDILFFAGQSETQSDGTTGVIMINPYESLNLADIKDTLQVAIKQGLKLAIFNSSDGLGLASQLARLNLPYIIVWRGEVSDVIAQKFLEYFLSSFTSGKSLVASFWEARHKLRELENLETQLPGVTWLPAIICQGTIEAPLFWSDLGGLIFCT